MAYCKALSRSPHGERGLKSAVVGSINIARSRSPHGERGLKLFFGSEELMTWESLSPRRAWIEIFWTVAGATGAASLSPRRAWIEILVTVERLKKLSSLSPRRAWIEIQLGGKIKAGRMSRSPHGERGLKFNVHQVSSSFSGSLSSRRAWIEMLRTKSHQKRLPVALLTESVD